MTRFYPRSFLLAVGCVAIFAMPALAIDETDFLAKLNAALKQQNIELLPDTITSSSESVLLSNAKIRIANDQTIALGSVELDNIKAVDDGYLIGKITTESIEIVTDIKDSKIVVEPVSIENYHLRGNNDSTSISTTSYAELLSLNGFSLLAGNETIFNSGFISVTTTVDAQTDRITNEGSARDLVVNLKAAVDNAESLAKLEKLELATLNGQLDFSASTILGTGEVTLDRMKLDVADIGSIDFNFGINGYTPQFAKRLRELSANAPKFSDGEENLSPEEQAEKDKKHSAYAMGTLALFSQLSVKNAGLSFDNSGLVELVLNNAALDNNMEPDDIRNALKLSIPVYLSGAGLGPYTQRITGALTSFLDDPKNLTVEVAPNDPLPVVSFVGIVTDLPAFLDVAKLSVSANK